VSKAGDVAQFEDQHRGDEGADAGDRTQPVHARIVSPALGDLVIELANLRIQHRQERAVILAEAAGDGGQRQALELPRVVNQLFPEVGWRLRRASMATWRLRSSPRSQTSWMRWRMSSRASRRAAGGIQTVGRRSPRSRSARRCASTRSFLRRAAAMALAV
jgi:hypothetical protein